MGAPMRALLFVLALLATAGVAEARVYRIDAGPDADARLRTALGVLQPGDQIRFGPGRFAITAPMRIAAERVTIRGQGPGVTVLDFTGAAAGDALALAANRLVVRGLSLENPQGDGLVVETGETVSLREVAVVWRGDAPAPPEADAIRIEAARAVLIERVTARGAPGAGLRLRGAESIVARESTFEGNAVGVAIGSTVAADLFLNRISANATGVILSDHPGLPRGRLVRLMENRIVDNGPAEAPADLERLGPGVGVLIGAAAQAFVMLNEIAGHGAANVALAASVERGADFTPVPQDVVLRDNRFGRSGFWTAGPLAAAGAMGADVLWDGATAFLTDRRPREEPVRFSLVNNVRTTGEAPIARNLNLRAAGAPLSEAYVTDDLPLVEPPPAPRPVRLR